jgi:phospholipid/cholesterol/gamma-HCH transport system ATP-binding protein
MAAPAPETIVAVREVVNRFGTQLVHDGVSFEVRRGEVFGIVGGSGSGKSVLLRTMLGLRRPDSGTVEVEGRDITRLDDQQLRAVKRRYGVTFQHGALFTSLTVNENIILPLVEAQPLSEDSLQSLAELRLRMVGLAVETGRKFPAQLSGGMIKRVALARALIMDPPLLLLDEPTAGLDPESADAFCNLLRSLHHELGLTVVMVTHDLDTLFELSTRVAVVADQKIIVNAPPREVIAFPHPFIHDFFLGERGQRAMELLREYPFTV